MVEVLKKDPLHENSAFLRFVEGVVDGELKLGDTTVTDRMGQDVDGLFDSREGNDLKTRENFQVQPTTFDDQSHDLSAELSSSLDKWWREEGDTSGTTHSRDNQYVFQPKNHYVDRALNSGSADTQHSFAAFNNDSLLKAEAEARLSPLDGSSWRALGLLLSWREEDGQAIKCLEKAIACDAYDSEAALALGTALCNEGEGFRGAQVLMEFASGIESLSSQQHTRASTYIDVANLRSDLINKLSRTGISDSAGYVALGVAKSLARDSAGARDAFANAVDMARSVTGLSGETQTPASLASTWNKLGATLANYGHPELALHCYSQALGIIPNAPRLWGNAAVALVALERQREAVAAFVTGLVHADGAEGSGLWSGLFATLMAMDEGSEAWSPEFVTRLGNLAGDRKLVEISRLVLPLSVLPIDGLDADQILSRVRDL